MREGGKAPNSKHQAPEKIHAPHFRWWRTGGKRGKPLMGQPHPGGPPARKIGHSQGSMAAGASPGWATEGQCIKIPLRYTGSVLIFSALVSGPGAHKSPRSPVRALVPRPAVRGPGCHRVPGHPPPFSRRTNSSPSWLDWGEKIQHGLAVLAAISWRTLRRAEARAPLRDVVRCA